jgi:hypothetical protein
MQRTTEHDIVRKIVPMMGIIPYTILFFITKLLPTEVVDRNSMNDRKATITQLPITQYHPLQEVEGLKHQKLE